MEINDKKHCVYAHINKTNGKMYIGQTCRKPKYRWNNGEGYKYCPYFYKAIQKYGWDNFEHEIVASNLTADEADNFERLLIEKLDTTNPMYGYNLRSGGHDGFIVNEETRKKIGEGNKGKCLSEETKRKIGDANKGKKRTEAQRQKLREVNTGRHLSEECKMKISESLKGEKNPNYGKPMSDEQRLKLSEVHKGKQNGENNPFYGRCHTEETKEKIRQANLGKKYPESRNKKISEANKNPSEETRKKMSESHKGDKNFKARKIIQLDKDGSFIREWNCMATAADECNVNKALLWSCCKHEPHCNTAGGFRWMYAEEYYNTI